MRLGNYIRSERFIHDDLVKKAEDIVVTVRNLWRTQRQVDPYVVTWPGEDIKADDGEVITHAVLCPIPAEFDRARRMQALQQIVERTKAYGLLFVEQKENSILVLFETRHGARSWCIPLAWHGDVQVPGQAEVKNNSECVGLLWREGSQH
jgi:hypothetical protein